MNKISTFAQGALTDGDDFHITGSIINENEENFSTIADASCMKMMGKTRNEQHNIRKFQEENKNASNKIIKIFLRTIRISHMKFRQTTIFRSSTNTVHGDYQEITEGDNTGICREKANHYDDSIAYNSSSRSTRNNIRTGRSMLVRQNAQVSGKSSLAQAKWDIRSSFAPGSTSYRNILKRQRSLTIDNSSCDGLSDITDDTSFYRSFSSEIQRPMFMNDDNSIDKGNKDRHHSSDVVEFDYDFRKISPYNDAPTELSFTKNQEESFLQTTKSNSGKFASRFSVSKNNKYSNRNAELINTTHHFPNPRSQFHSNGDPWWPKSRTYSDPLAQNNNSAFDNELLLLSSRIGVGNASDDFHNSKTRLRTYSDSAIYERSFSKIPAWNHLPNYDPVEHFDDQDELLLTDYSFNTLKLGSSPMSSRASHFTSTALSSYKFLPRTHQKNVMENTDSNNNTNSDGISPRVLTALRPAPASMQPILPKSSSHQGPDNDELFNKISSNDELHEQEEGIQWPTELFDDIFL